MVMAGAYVAVTGLVGMPALLRRGACTRSPPTGPSTPSSTPAPSRPAIDAAPHACRPGVDARCRMAGADEHGVTRGTVVIDVDACKGCDLCIDACPPGVLVMTTDDGQQRAGYRFPLLSEGCTGCAACSAICPDFVFQVYKYDTPLVVEAAEAR